MNTKLKAFLYTVLLLGGLMGLCILGIMFVTLYMIQTAFIIVMFSFLALVVYEGILASLKSKE